MPTSITIFTANSACQELGKVTVAHVCMFKGSTVDFHCHLKEDQLQLIQILLKAYVTFTCEGMKLTVDISQFQRVYFRIDG